MGVWRRADGQNNRFGGIDTVAAADRFWPGSDRWHQWDEFLLSGRPVIAWMPVRGCGFM